MSSSTIINKLQLALDDNQVEFLKSIKKSEIFSKLEKSLNKIKKDNVMVVGDLIIDKYIFGNVQGKSGKDHIWYLVTNLRKCILVVQQL